MKDHIKKAAAARKALHDGQPSQRVLSVYHDQVGLAGEFVFGRFCGLFPDTSLRAEGDRGVDFRLPLLFTVDVKTARRPYALLHEKGKPIADIYVLAAYHETEEEASLVGWDWGSAVKRAEVRTSPHGITNYYIPADRLRPMAELQKRINT